MSNSFPTWSELREAELELEKSLLDLERDKLAAQLAAVQVKTQAVIVNCCEVRLMDMKQAAGIK